ncbi:D-inositol 3-phosphate glycosyltransferase [Cocos nucifera]|uniref:D-inositol 3-phosphate glycosyltransferase n=1 Tax=Cocos nucifera TaxID=13894 RepID=A0A8K0IU53_COCNU|nr:D-inositol 3-phosphate glycosyltransferase [Cocos nucifera]
MGSLETAVSLKRAPLLRSSPSPGGRSIFHRPRSRLARFLLFEKVDYLQWICTMAAFFFVVILFQAFLPGSVMEKSAGLGWNKGLGEGERGVLERIEGLDFGEGIRFVPSKLLERFEKERKEANLSLMALGRPVKQVGLLKPRLALVVPDLSSDAMQLQMVSIAAALKEIGYDIEVFSFEGGPALAAWRAVRIPVYFLPINTKPEITVDWLDYHGILVSTLDAKPVLAWSNYKIEQRISFKHSWKNIPIDCENLSKLQMEPFKSIPVIWTIHERSLALRLSQYATNGQVQLINDWKQVFNRATVVVFPTYLLLMMYSGFDLGNYFVIPGSPAEAWGADRFFAKHSDHDLRVNMGYESEDLLIAIVGSQFTYSGMWLEQALILQALAPLLNEFPSENTSHSLLKVGILSGNSTSAYKMAIETIALKVGYPRGIVELVVFDEDMNSFLGIADLVIYGSFLEEQSFPKVLMQAMNLGKLVIAPDLGMIRRYVDDRVNGYLFPKKNIGMLTEIMFQAVSNGKLSLSAQKIASIGKVHARNLMASESIKGYALLLENILKFSSEIASPKAAEEIPLKLKEEWQWHLFENVSDAKNLNRSFKSYKLLDKLEEQWSGSQMESSANTTLMIDEAFSSISWEEEKRIEMVNFRSRLEEEELKDRSDQPHGTWEEVYRNVKRADRTRNELHERDDRELERTGQPLCIYEPYFGEGTWPFLHHTSLYRGIGLSTKGRRPGADDIDASSRLPLLSNAYYRDVLGEYGAFFALANRIDRIHKNAWIGFQSWRASARKLQQAVKLLQLDLWSNDLGQIFAAEDMGHAVLDGAVWCGVGGVADVRDGGVPVALLCIIEGRGLQHGSRCVGGDEQRDVGGVDGASIVIGDHRLIVSNYGDGWLKAYDAASDVWWGVEGSWGAIGAKVAIYHEQQCEWRDLCGGEWAGSADRDNDGRRNEGGARGEREVEGEVGGGEEAAGVH